MRTGFEKDDDDEAKAQNPTEERTGWAFMQDYTLTHDKVFVKDLSDDIETMLIFAGLFSAVLTTFLGVSLLLLQQDSTVPVLQRLDRISMQLERLSFTSSPGYINSTLPPIPLQSSSFVPPTSVRWVNILWFLSLVLSLSAALFGILAKQWLREYMQWNAALGIPSENLLVRQIRYEAWNDWNVDATISAIPALLELALVMFLVGLLVFLATLDLVVAIVITIAVGIVILITITLTIAPALWKRCPYKSPTAWAVVGLCRWTWHLYSHSRSSIGGLGNSQSGWKDRDIEGDHSEPLLSSYDEALRAASQNPLGPPTTATLPEQARVPRVEFMAALSADVTLMRALNWVSQASEDPRVPRNVSVCSQGFKWRSRPFSESAPFDKQLDERLFLIWSLMLLITLPTHSSDAPNQITLPTFILTTRRTLWETYGIGQQPVDGKDATFRPDNHRLRPLDNNSTFGCTWNPGARDIVVDLLYDTILAIFHNLDQDPPGQHAIELLHLAHAITSANSESGPSATFISNLVEAYNSAYVGPTSIVWRSRIQEHPGMRSSLLQFIWQFREIAFEDDSGKLLESPVLFGSDNMASRSARKDHLFNLLKGLLATKRSEDLYLAMMMFDDWLSMEPTDLSNRPQPIADLWHVSTFIIDWTTVPGCLWDRFLIDIAQSSMARVDEVCGWLHGITWQDRAPNRRRVAAVLRGEFSGMYYKSEILRRRRLDTSELAKLLGRMEMEDPVEGMMSASTRPRGDPDRLAQQTWHADEWLNSLRWDNQRGPDALDPILRRLIDIAKLAQQAYTFRDQWNLPWYDTLVCRERKVYSILVGHDRTQKTLKELIDVLLDTIHYGRIFGSAKTGIPKLYHELHGPPTLESILYLGLAEESQVDDQLMSARYIWLVAEYLGSPTLADDLSTNNGRDIMNSVLRRMKDGVDAYRHSKSWREDMELPPVIAFLFGSHPWFSRFADKNYRVARLLRTQNQSSFSELCGSLLKAEQDREWVLRRLPCQTHAYLMRLLQRVANAKDDWAGNDQAFNDFISATRAELMTRLPAEQQDTEEADESTQVEQEVRELDVVEEAERDVPGVEEAERGAPSVEEDVGGA